MDRGMVCMIHSATFRIGRLVWVLLVGIYVVRGTVPFLAIWIGCLALYHEIIIIIIVVIRVRVRRIIIIIVGGGRRRGGVVIVHVCHVELNYLILDRPKIKAGNIQSSNTAL